MIDVNKNLQIAKTTKKEENLKLTNELKLITAPMMSTSCGLR